MKKTTLPVLAMAILLPMSVSAQNQTTTSNSEVGIATITPVSNEEIIYYDYNWKGVPSAEYATFIRKIIRYADPNYHTRYKDSYKDGGVCGEGTLVAADKYDDTKTIYLEGKKMRKDGSLEMTFTMADGKKRFVTYNDDGSRCLEGMMVGDKYEGAIREYLNDGQAWIEKFYVHGELDTSKSEYISNTIYGDMAHYSLSTNQQIGMESPDASDYKEEFEDGMRWTVVRKNGIEIAICADHARDYGGKQGFLAASIARELRGDNGKKEYTRVSVFIKNNTTQSIKFDPSQIESKGIVKKKPKDINWLSFTDFTKSMDKAQRNALAITKIDMEHEAKNMATTSRTSNETSTDVHRENETSHTTTKGHSTKTDKHINERDVHVENRDYHETVDAEQYARNMEVAREEIARYSDELQIVNESKRQAYLQPVQIDPFQSYSGFIYTRELKYKQIEYNIVINGITYPFSINVSDTHS